MRFRDSVIWITGASSGIGKKTAKQFHAEGAHIVFSAQREGDLNRVVDKCVGPGDTVVLPLDVVEESAVSATTGEILARFGQIDILVNNAELMQRGRIVETNLDVYRRIIDVNFFGPLMPTKAVLPSMLDRKAGQVVCVTSVAGKYGSPMRSGYNAAKLAAHGYYDSLHEEVSSKGIGLTLIVPGKVWTNVSLNALRGDGSLYNRMAPFLESGMAPADCARRILTVVHAASRKC